MIEQAVDTRQALDATAVKALAHSLWSADVKARQPDASPEQRKNIWAEEKKEFLFRARGLMRQLKRKGFELAKPIETKRVRRKKTLTPLSKKSLG